VYHYIGLDVHKETIAVALANWSRRKPKGLSRACGRAGPTSLAAARCTKRNHAAGLARSGFRFHDDQARVSGCLANRLLRRIWNIKTNQCKEMGVRPSMGSVGDCIDNAMCESFFATLECELLDRRNFPTKAEARVACF